MLDSKSSPDSISEYSEYSWLTISENIWRVLKRAILNRFVNFVEGLLRYPEPSIVWKLDRQNHPYLEIYDPMTQKYHFFRSEQDALVWLEHRFYH